ncbi:arginase family protein [Candidatus Woesearchaeota archaeon]|nr:arginase family protein [Candidatus Woesearchaeota archaeon]
MIISIASSQGGLEKKGSQKAPAKIIEQLKNFYLSEQGRKPAIDISEVGVVSGNIEETNDKIYEKIKNATTPLIIGGDHSITFSAFKAFATNFKNPGLLIFDAHPDCVNNFHPPSHEDFVKVLIEDGNLKPENIVIFGLRNWHDKEYRFLKENRIKFFTMQQIFNNIEQVCDTVMEFSRVFDGLYFSIDIDVVDPAFAPGTGYAEPGGLTSREMIYLIHRIKMLNNLKAVDIVEVDPEKDVNGITSKLAAKIICELL